MAEKMLRIFLKTELQQISATQRNRKINPTNCIIQSNSNTKLHYKHWQHMPNVLPNVKIIQSEKEMSQITMFIGDSRDQQSCNTLIMENVASRRFGTY